MSEEEREVTQNQRIELDEGEYHFVIWRQKATGGKVRRSSWLDWKHVRFIPPLKEDQRVVVKALENVMDENDAWKAWGCVLVVILAVVLFCGGLWIIFTHSAG